MRPMPFLEPCTMALVQLLAAGASVGVRQVVEIGVAHMPLCYGPLCCGGAAADGGNGAYLGLGWVRD